MRDVRADSSPICEGIGPYADGSDGKLMLTTRWSVVVELHVTPCHEHHAGVPVPENVHAALPVLCHGEPATAAVKKGSEEGYVNKEE